MTSAFEPVNKQAVASAFSRAASSYDSAAVLQRDVGERLLGMGAKHRGEQLLDAGCGTGHFSRRWRELGKQVTALDLAPGMLAFARQQQAADHYLLGDIENVPLPAAAVDICFSSLVVQWCSDLPRALAELYRVTRPGGVILFSTLAEGSLAELGDAWQQVDGERHVNDFLSLAQIDAACAGYRHLLETERQTLNYPDVMALMRSLKGIGATHLHQGREAGLLSRRRLAALQAAYPRRGGQFPLSYHLVYGVIYRD
ncbi:malonyl-ACP O-methyltransferase BioC [Serratia plymuthica]|uniref:Malonyl-[acyl-carrier protein] O-methyltransferase n=1 Tax=Serratia plymuthica TaxID=82996 RepID=A0A2X4U4Q0_SERPL|nr:malonyl-ACP O-methyltransferase BioC [Serratia plymuthica]QPS21921.1 malonyl-ACP O-methyltransferase BioC [Serratia plymuthica]QPS63533.1 malonyl-ACP O-methyltransferase BioC [Serratia plymuthica]RKS64100.1 pimeloyl-CoA biosynthesis protein BioC [Serratia plymuthica]CAI2530239.1 Malonyl-CoA O-methyltransferase BioC [Serratia plymuthica]SQI34173.1 Malonyl-CoA O-methyltransferase BioC [Serratia plymuthica]